MAETPTLPGTPGPDPQSQDALWRRIAREMRLEITRESREDDDFDDEANAIAVGIIVLGLLVAAFFLIRPFFQEKPVDPVYTKLEAIKRIQELTLVKQHYRSLIPVTEKGKPDELEFLLRAPVQVLGNLDMSRVRFELAPDSLIIVTLPPASIQEPYLDIQEAEVFTIGNNVFQRISTRFFTKQTRYLDAYDQIVAALASATDSVYQRALRNDIEQETMDQAELYLRSLIGSLGYRIEFIRPDDYLPPLGADSTTMAQWQRRLQGMELPVASDLRRETRAGVFRRLFSTN